MSAARTTIYRHRVRYLEADQQGVVFNMWYLGYFDEAMAQFLEEGGALGVGGSGPGGQGAPLIDAAEGGLGGPHLLIDRRRIG